MGVLRFMKFRKLCFIRNLQCAKKVVVSTPNEYVYTYKNIAFLVRPPV